MTGDGPLVIGIQVEDQVFDGYYLEDLTLQVAFEALSSTVITLALRFIGASKDLLRR
jgi:hypothetical protein